MLAEMPLNPPLRIGQPLPLFTARSTTGTISLSDYRGRWALLFSHPADFTPVCTSEFIALAQAKAQFAALDCALIGLSVDSVYAHFAWIRTIHELSGAVVDFPIIEDPSLEIGRAYGMIDNQAENAATIRTTFVIDPDGVLAAMQTYPVTVGRSVPELLRLLAGLQAVRQGEGLAPANWQPGEPLLRPACETVGEALAAGGPGDWFYSPATKDA